MKYFTLFFVLSAVVLGLVITPSVFGQQASNVTLQLDQLVYGADDDVIITGTVDVVTGAQVSISMVFQARIVFSMSVPVNPDGTFSLTIPASQTPFEESGDYRARAFYERILVSVPFQVALVDPEPEPEPIIVTINADASQYSTGDIIIITGNAFPVVPDVQGVVSVRLLGQVVTTIPTVINQVSGDYSVQIDTSDRNIFSGTGSVLLAFSYEGKNATMSVFFNFISEDIPTLFIQTDQSVYEIGDILMFSGQLTPVTISQDIDITFLLGTQIINDTITQSELDGTYSGTIPLNTPLFEQGEQYTIRATFENLTDTISFTIQEDVMPPDPDLETRVTALESDVSDIQVFIQNLRNLIDQSFVTLETMQSVIINIPDNQNSNNLGEETSVMITITTDESVYNLGEDITITGTVDEPILEKIPVVVEVINRESVSVKTFTFDIIRLDGEFGTIITEEIPAGNYTVRATTSQGETAESTFTVTALIIGDITVTNLEGNALEDSKVGDRIQINVPATFLGTGNERSEIARINFKIIEPDANVINENRLLNRLGAGSSITISFVYELTKVGAYFVDVTIVEGINATGAVLLEQTRFNGGTIPAPSETFTASDLTIRDRKTNEVLVRDIQTEEIVTIGAIVNNDQSNAVTYFYTIDINDPDFGGGVGFNKTINLVTVQDTVFWTWGALKAGTYTITLSIFDNGTDLNPLITPLQLSVVVAGEDKLTTGDLEELVSQLETQVTDLQARVAALEAQ